VWRHIGISCIGSGPESVNRISVVCVVNSICGIGTGMESDPAIGLLVQSKGQNQSGRSCRSEMTLGGESVSGEYRGK
jgi:hypothetical protein